MEFEHQTIRTNGVNLHVVQAGPVDGPLVILLHGFPEFWRGFIKQIPVLAEAGYSVWAPDQRGYNLSDKPKGVAHYNLDELTKDVVGLIDAAGRETAFVVGHDWGAAVAWWTAVNYAERVEKLAILNVPHPAVMRRYMTRHLSQLRRSWYMFFFQIPWLPESLLRLNNWEGTVRAVQGSAHPGTFTDADMDRYREAWSQPGAFTAMINWYRAIFRHPPAPAGGVRVTVPVRIIWGKRDFALEWQLAEESLELCDASEVIYLDEATHWVQHEEPARVNELLLTFFDGKDLSL